MAAKQNQIDAASNPAINPVRLLDGRIVSWAEAFPRDSAKVCADVRAARGDLS